MVATHNQPIEAATVPATARKILEGAHTLVPSLRQARAEIEQQRRLPGQVVQLLRSAGAFRAAAPAAWGGPEMTSMQQTELVEIIATGDVSAAWCAMIGMDSGIYSGFLRDEVAHALYPHLDMVNAGWIHPQGKAQRVPHGFNVTGQWRFGSGITHCDVLVAGCVVYRDGRPEPDPATGDPQHWRVMVCRPTDFEVRDTWHTTGLAGSGSLDYATTGLFVPEEHSFSFAQPQRPGPLHSAPDAILRKMSGVPLGMARARIDHVLTMVPERIDRETKVRWADEGRVQTAIARAEMQLAAVRAQVYESLHTQWRKLSDDEPLTDQERVSTALARYHAFRTCRDIVQALYDLVGGVATFRKSPMDRWLRDAQTMCQHAVAQDSILQLTGNILLGGRSTSPFL